jgi:hypothetical protein
MEGLVGWAGMRVEVSSNSVDVVRGSRVVVPGVTDGLFIRTEGEQAAASRIKQAVRKNLAQGMEKTVLEFRICSA